MKTKTIKLYEYGELSKEAKEKALTHFRENSFDDTYLKVELDNRLQELLEEYEIKPTEDLKGYATKYATLYYSLSHSQGDGAMFEGVFEWKQYTIRITYSGRYYHSKSGIIEIQETDNPGFHMDDEHKDVLKFDKIYDKICAVIEKLGYEIIEDIQSEAYFIEQCNVNEWTFREDGTMENN